MLLREFFIDQIDEKQIWARSGQNAVRKFRCSAGPRKGRIVAKPATCNAPKNMKASNTLKQTRRKWVR